MNCDEWKKNITTKIIGILVFGVFQKMATASMPIPAPMSLEVYIKYYSPKIFIGNFDGMVYISKNLGEKLWNPNAEITASELIFSNKETSSAGGGSFMRISEMKLIFLPKNNPKIPCNYLIAYHPHSIFSQSKSEYDTYYRSLIGQRIIFFFNGPAKYGKNLIEFPSPMFYSAGGVSWQDGMPLSIDHLSEVGRLAEQAGLVSPGAEFCKR